MKIKEIIKETHEDTIENIRNECSQTIDLMNKTKKEIYHRSNYNYLNIEKITPKTGRKPKDTPQIFHYLINDYLDEKGIKTNRSNSIFGFKAIAPFGYGKNSFVLFPVNNPNILWFEKSYDLYVSLYKYVENNINKNIDDVSENDIDKEKFKEYLNTLEPKTSLKEYLNNNNNDIEILISSPLYLVKKEIFKTKEFREQIGLL